MTLELTADNLREYLVSSGQFSPETQVEVSPLAWGVSNLVLRVDPAVGPSLVVKQSRPQLRTRVEWFSRCERIFREADMLRALAPLVPAGALPRVLFEDRAHYILGLEAIRADHEVWKAALLEGRIDLKVAAQLGRYLGDIHRQTAGRFDLLPDAADWSLFDELRIDPFYRWIARAHREIATPIDDLIDEMSRHRICLVHADFSPKNVLVHPDGVSLVDFETGHWGDPAFDLGFFISHLLLKSLRWVDQSMAWRQMIATFWRQYREYVDQGSVSAVNSTSTTARVPRHLLACLLARIDGKSTVDYLNESWQPEFVRRFTLAGLQSPPATLEHALDEFFETLQAELELSR